MATEEEEKTWGARLKEGGYVIRRINLQNDDMMKAIYKLLEITENFPKQTQLDEFIDKQKHANAMAQLEGPRNKKPRGMIDRYVKGVNPKSHSTLKRERLVMRVLERSSRAELILLKGPAAVGKTSVMNLVDHFCRTNAEYTLNGLPCPTPVTFCTWMERDGKPAGEQLREALAKMGGWKENDPKRILFCDDVQNVNISFWESLLNTTFFKDNHVRIVGATTRRCASDPASPILEEESVIAFPELCLDGQEEAMLFDKFLSSKTYLCALQQDELNMVLAAVTDQCGGHVFAIIASLDKLDDFAALDQNRNASTIISHLLSKSFLDHSYTRIWPKNTDSFTSQDRRSLQLAILDDSNKVSVEIQTLLMKIYFLQDTGQELKERSWTEVKRETTFNLASRRLYHFLFPSRGKEDFKATSLVELVRQTLQGFSLVDLQQACGASAKAAAKGASAKAEAKGFPKEVALQQMFFASITNLLPATTEVIAEMSAILPNRGDNKRGELDFYVNSNYFYGIELMREGGSFKEHLDRFKKPDSSDPNKGKYYTPLIKQYLIVDFRSAHYSTKGTSNFRLIVRFDKDYGSCSLSLGDTNLGKIGFK